MVSSALLLFFLLAAMVAMSEAAVYKVGGSIGWTILNSPNYTAWTVGKTFYVGDTILFEYNSQYHNVLEVTKASYTACKAASPLATYTTGNDSIPMKTKGHHYFICGVPGHCDGGQMVDILVSTSASSHASSTVPAPAPAPEPTMPPTPAPAPSPKANGAPSATGMGVAYALGVAAIIYGLLVVS